MSFLEKNKSLFVSLNEFIRKSCLTFELSPLQLSDVILMIAVLRCVSVCARVHAFSRAGRKLSVCF